MLHKLGCSHTTHVVVESDASTVHHNWDDTNNSVSLFAVDATWNATVAWRSAGSKYFAAHLKSTPQLSTEKIFYRCRVDFERSEEVTHLAHVATETFGDVTLTVVFSTWRHKSQCKCCYRKTLIMDGPAGTTHKLICAKHESQRPQPSIGFLHRRDFFSPTRTQRFELGVVAT